MPRSSWQGECSKGQQSLEGQSPTVNSGEERTGTALLPESSLSARHSEAGDLGALEYFCWTDPFVGNVRCEMEMRHCAAT